MIIFSVLVTLLQSVDPSLLLFISFAFSFSKIHFRRADVKESVFSLVLFSHLAQVLSASLLGFPTNGHNNHRVTY